MVRIRHGWLVAVIGLALPLATACKNEKKSDPAGETKSSDGAEKSAPAAKADDLSLLPVDSELVMGINVAQVQASELWKKLVEPNMQKGDAMREVNKYKEKCGIDPMTALTSVSLGLKFSGGKPEGAIVAHGVDKSKAWTCLDSMKADMTKEGVEYTREGETALFKGANGQAAATFVNNNTLLVVVGHHGTSPGIKTVAAGGSGIKSSPAFVEMYGKLNTKDSLWVLVNGRVLDNLATIGVKAKAIYGTVNVTDGLATDMRAAMESAEDATRVAEMAKGQVAQAVQMVDKVDVTSEGSEVRINMVMSKQKLDALISQFGGMLGAFGGMGGR